MSDITTLGSMLRNYTVDPELPVELGPSLTAFMLKHSDLHAAFGAGAEDLAFPAFLQPEQYSRPEGAEEELAAEAAAFLKEQGNTMIHDTLTADCILLAEEGPEIRYPEKVWRGPFGYDAAALTVSALLGWCLGNAEIRDEFQRDDFCDCCLDLAANLVDQVVWNYDGLFEELADAPKAGEEDFKRTYFEKMMSLLAAAAGLEALRVLRGDRPSKELENITDPKKREEAEQVLMFFAECCIRERDSFYFGADFAAVIERAGRSVKNRV